MKVFIFLGLLMLAACAGPEKKEELRLVPTSYDALQGWAQDDHAAALATFTKSCEKTKWKKDDAAIGPMAWSGMAADYKRICDSVPSIATSETARAFFEYYFAPYKVFADEKRDGLLTGYYEPSLNGARTKYGPYQTPIYALPDDLVMVDLGQFREHLKGERIAGRVKGNRLKPYEARAEIEAGELPLKQQKPIAYVDDPIDAFFLHIQGSGRVQLDTGEVLRVGYAGQNGHPYYAIGRALIKRGELNKETVSLQSIKAWMMAHPDQAQDLMNLNASYVFFEDKGKDGPFGAQNVALTPDRSIAIDRTLYPYGLPIWVEAEHPDEAQPDIKRLMIAQDTGGAIRGIVRGDYFWGHGARAEQYAGDMKSKTRFWVLIPKSVSVQ